MSTPQHVIVNNDLKIDVVSEAFTNPNVIQTSSNSFQVLFKNESVKTEILESDFNTKTYTITINNNKYIVRINDALDEVIHNLERTNVTKNSIDKITAPIPGLITEVVVSEGQKVNEGDHLLTFEAMKMENSIMAPQSGIIKNVLVSKDESVDTNQLLIAFE